jgi:hypothetical protein
MLTSQLFAVIHSRTRGIASFARPSKQDVGKQRQRCDQQRQGEKRHRIVEGTAIDSPKPQRCFVR